MTNKNERTNWYLAAERLGLQLSNTSGTRAKCPLCHEGIVRLYADTVFGGRRFSCSSCGGDGDLLDLIAAADGSERVIALNKLADISPDLHFAYTCDAERRQRLEAGQQILDSIWQAGTVLTRGANSETFQRILKNRGLTFNHTSSFHAENMDRQYRIIASERVEAAIASAGEAALSRAAKVTTYTGRGGH